MVEPRGKQSNSTPPPLTKGDSSVQYLSLIHISKNVPPAAAVLDEMDPLFVLSSLRRNTMKRKGTRIFALLLAAVLLLGGLRCV